MISTPQEDRPGIFPMQPSDGSGQVQGEGEDRETSSAVKGSTQIGSIWLTLPHWISLEERLNPVILMEYAN